MKIIAIEEHFLTTELGTAWDAAPSKDPSAALNAGPLGARLLDFDVERIQLMDETGVDVQVLAATSPGLSNLGAESIALAQRTNDFLAARLTAHPDRFQGLALLPTPMPAAAPAELERAVRELGLKGAMIYGRTGDKRMDHKDFWPIYEAAEALKVPLLIHPQIPAEATRAALYSGFGDKVDLALSTFGIGWHYEAGIEFVRMVLAGVFDRFPDLQVILGHWGELVLFYAERLAMLDRVSGLERPFLDYTRRNLYLTASGLFFPEYFRRAEALVGASRLLFSTDYPYQYRPGGEARQFLDKLEIPAAEKGAFAHANWERLVGG